MNVTRNVWLGAGLLLLSAARPVGAQDRPDSLQNRDRCRRAAAVVATGHPAPQDRWAFQAIRTCGQPGAAAIAAGLGATRSEAYGPDLDRLAGLTLWFRDGQLFRQAMNVARDPGASLAARLFALRAVVWQIESTPLGGADYASIATGTPYDGRFHCPGDAMVDFERMDGAPLPSTYLDDAFQLGVKMMHDDSLAPDLRRMGACVWATASYEQGRAQGQ